MTPAEQLRTEGAAELVAGRAPRDDDAGCGGDEQGRDLRGERVTDAQDGERLGSLAQVHPARDAEDEATDEVDRRDRAGRRWRRRERTCSRRPSLRRSRPPAPAPSAAARAWSAVRAPDDTSASTAICLPGIASSVKRAATSATRPAPFVTTMKLMTARMRKTTRPTSTFPSTTKRPNASTTIQRLPAPRRREAG